MTKAFDPTMNLPTGTGTHANLSKYSEVLNQHSTSLGHTVSAFVGGEFVKPDNIAPVEVKLGSQSFSVCDATEHIDAALHLADQYAHESEVHTTFLKRFSGLLTREFPVLMAYAACYLGVDLADTLDFDWAVIDESLTVPVTHQVSPSVSYFVGANEIDAVFHLTRILSFLRHPFTGVRHRGVVVICHSLCLLPFFFLLSRIVEQATPPTNLFTFLPLLAELSNVSVTANLSIILKSADIDSAVRSCVASLFAGCGTKSWKACIVLVEEAILPRVLNRLKHILSTNAHTGTKSGVHGQLPKIEQYLKDIVLPDGGEVITPDGAPNGPFVITNMALSAVARFPFEDLPVSHLFPFRTVKEAAAMASHCVNLASSRYDPILSSRKRVNICANLWTTSFPMAWYLATSLGKSGLSNIFINSSHQQVTSKMYGLSFEPNRVDVYSAARCATGALADAFLEQSSIVKLLSSALMAQLSWSAVTPRNREKLLRLASDTLDNTSKSIFHRMSHLFETSVGKEVWKLENSELMPLSTGRPILAHEWLLPTGPIVILVPDKDAAPMLLHVCLYALLAGNAVVIVCWKDTVCDEMAHVHSLRPVLPNSDLVSVYSCAPSCTMSDMLGILAETYHPGIVIPPGLLRTNSSDGLLTNSGIFQPWRSYFKRSVRLFWSIGDNTFID